MKRWFKRLFCLHVWESGLGENWFKNGCKTPPYAGMMWGEGVFEHYHCVKCGKVISSNTIPIGYKEKE